MKDRNLDYDFLRFIGIACIIMAHVGPNGYIFQIRNFDVPLMVLLSGMSFGAFSSNNYTSYSKYLLGRFHRLVVPTWLFLLFLNVIIFFMKNETPTFLEIIKQITLIGGLGIGIWIVRIFFSMAVIAPFTKEFNEKINSDKLFYSLLVTSWIFYEIIVYFAKACLPLIHFEICNILFFFTFSYGCFFLLGLRLLKATKKQLEKLALISCSLFAISFIALYLHENRIIATQAFKYPPRFYYISYALAISFILIYFSKYTSMFNFFKNNLIVQFVGRSTLWIYLWHWLSLKVLTYIQIDTHMITKYFLVFISATAITYIQTKAIKTIPIIVKIDATRYKRYQTIFTG